MVAQPVEWVLVVYYGPSAHRATYGRLKGPPNTYTKDFIQLTNKHLDALTHLFPITEGATGSVPLTYKWPKDIAPGAFVYKSSDRPHLKWETSLGAPKAWKMTLDPSDSVAETIPGDPSHTNVDDAEKEFALLKSRGAGQPYLMAVKLRDEPRTLHLRAYLKNPAEGYAWADLGLVPKEIQNLAAKTSRSSALASSLFPSDGIAPSAKINDALSKLVASEDWMSVIGALDADTGRALTSYLRYPGHGLFFDPTRNHDAWSKPAPLSEQVKASVGAFLEALEVSFPTTSQGDAAAETLDVDPDEVESFGEQIEQKNYEVPDSTATTKTRGSAQKAFAKAVKTNYGYRCAVTGVVTKDFLVASHIVPWSDDQSIRLDPSNGICLSLVADRAFEKGYLQVEDDLTIRIDLERVGEDKALRSQLEPYDKKKLNAPAKEAPLPAYLHRRRALFAPANKLSEKGAKRPKVAGKGDGES